MQTSFKDYVESEKQKVMINSIIQDAFSEIPKEEYEQMTNLVYNKINKLNEIRALMKHRGDESLQKSAKESGVNIDTVLDGIIYFSLIIENAWLTKMLSDYQTGD